MSDEEMQQTPDPPPHPAYVRHPLFYLDGDTSVFLIEQDGVLIRVSAKQFCRRSPAIRNMFAVKSGATDTQIPQGPEGMSDDLPIRLVYGSMAEHEDFLPLIFPQSIDDFTPLESRSPQVLLNILRLSDYYEMTAEVERCISALSAHKDFDPAHKLYASHERRIAEWRLPALRALLGIGTHAFTPDQLGWLHRFHLDGFPVFCSLAALEARISHHRLVVAAQGATPGAVEDCPNHPRCISNWQTTWYAGIVPHWIHPVLPCTEVRLKELLQQVTIKMNDGCRERSVRRLVEGSALNSIESWIVDLEQRLGEAVPAPVTT